MGTHEGCPYGDDPVNVIGHDNKRIQVCAGTPSRQFVPHCLNQPTCVIEMHRPVHNITKEALSVLCADRHEIGAFPGIIESLEAKGSTAVRRGAACCARGTVACSAHEGRSKQRPYTDIPKGIVR